MGSSPQKKKKKNHEAPNRGLPHGKWCHSLTHPHFPSLCSPTSLFSITGKRSIVPRYYPPSLLSLPRGDSLSLSSSLSLVSSVISFSLFLPLSSMAAPSTIRATSSRWRARTRALRPEHAKRVGARSVYHEMSSLAAVEEHDGPRWTHCSNAGQQLFLTVILGAVMFSIASPSK